MGHSTRMVCLRPLWVFALVVVLSGCFGGDPDDGGQRDDEGPDGGRNGESDPEPVRLGEEPPRWNVGDYWEYETSEGRNVGFVVSTESGGHWTVDTTDEHMAWRHTRGEDTLVGSIRMEDLAVAHGDDYTRWLDFPLEENKTWTTVWNGTEVDVAVVSAGETFLFHLHEDGDLAVVYEYDPGVGWFTSQEVLDADGQERSSMTLRDAQSDWSGIVVRWEAEHKFTGRATGNGAGMGGEFVIQEDFDELWTHVFLHCPNGQATRYIIHWGPSDLLAIQQREIIEGTECGPLDEIVITEDPPQGDWDVSMQWLGAGGQNPWGTAEIWSRTMEHHVVP